MNEPVTNARPLQHAPRTGPEPLLQITDLELQYRRRRSVTPVLRGVSLEVSPGQTLGVVGESGSGKSQTMLAAIRLLAPGAELPHGSINFDGIDITHASEDVVQRLRGHDLAMVFQDPMSSLDPVMRIGDQIAESLLAHRRSNPRAGVAAKVTELMEQVGLPDPERLRRRYPHQLSGGQRQRVGIAMAMANSPRLLIADEPTTALDVTVQAQILELLRELQRSNSMAMILITHDLALVGQYADQVAVMYAGEVVEQGSTVEVFANPRHPYTRGLMASRPRLGGPGRKDQALSTISGAPMDAAAAGAGCAFLPRCSHSVDRGLCGESAPDLVRRLDDEGTHLARCHFPIIDSPQNSEERR